MSLDADLHVLAGLTAAVLGAGALWRAPAGGRNRLFAGLCASLALWNLGVGVPALLGRPPQSLERVYLLGGCFAPAIAWHFAVAGGLRRGAMRAALASAGYLAAGGLWVAALLGARSHGSAWSTTTIVVLGLLLLVTLGLFLRQLLALPGGPARRAHGLLLGTAVAAALAGLSDLLPRDGLPRFGPLLLLPFLFVLCGLVVRHRFLDLDAFLARAVALGLGAALASLLVLGAVRLAGGPRLLPVFAACLVVLASAGPLGRALFRRTRRLLQPGASDARVLEEATRSVAAAERPAEVWARLEEARRSLGEQVRLLVHLRDPGGQVLPAAALGPGARSSARAEPEALAGLLWRERGAVTRRIVDEELRASRASRREEWSRVAGELEELDASLVAPVLRGESLAGWVTLGGLQEDRLSGELAAALEALGSQALAVLERLEAREAARRSESLAAVGELAAGLAHEIRNPLGAIRGAAQVLAEARDEEQEAEMLAVLDEETGRLGRVVGEFLAYARPDSPRRERIELERLLESVLREAAMAGFAPRAQISVAPETPAALGDPDQLHRAFGNLVRNAFEAAGPEGRLSIAVRAAGDGMINLRFEDDGPGVPPEEAARVFQPFHTTRSGGTGLGLALAQRVVESHGGSIELDPRPGLGAVFTVRLPAEAER